MESPDSEYSSTLDRSETSSQQQPQQQQPQQARHFQQQQFQPYLPPYSTHTIQDSNQQQEYQKAHGSFQNYIAYTQPPIYDPLIERQQQPPIPPPPPPQQQQEQQRQQFLSQPPIPNLGNHQYSIPQLNSMAGRQQFISQQFYLPPSANYNHYDRVTGFVTSQEEGYVQQQYPNRPQQYQTDFQPQQQPPPPLHNPFEYPQASISSYATYSRPYYQSGMYPSLHDRNQSLQPAEVHHSVNLHYYQNTGNQLSAAESQVSMNSTDSLNMPVSGGGGPSQVLLPPPPLIHTHSYSQSQQQPLQQSLVSEGSLQQSYPSSPALPIGGKPREQGNHPVSKRKKRKPGAYRCSECSRVFTRNWNLKQHFDIDHLKKPSTKCPLCIKCFNRKSDLNRHIKEIHRNTQRQVTLPEPPVEPKSMQSSLSNDDNPGSSVRR